MTNGEYVCNMSSLIVGMVYIVLCELLVAVIKRVFFDAQVYLVLEPYEQKLQYGDLNYHDNIDPVHDEVCLFTVDPPFRFILTVQVNCQLHIYGKVNIYRAQLNPSVVF